MSMNAADIIMIVVAFSTNDGEMALWSNSMFFLPFTVAITDFMTMNNVVVLIPPPVELGEPPIKMANNIKRIVAIGLHEYRAYHVVSTPIVIAEATIYHRASIDAIVGLNDCVGIKDGW